jgi:hypothetical protein
MVLEKIDNLLRDLYSLSNMEVVHLMKELIPEYHTTNGTFKFNQKAV